MIKINSYKVYAHINEINGKIYIGVTKQELHKRFGKNGNGYKGQRFYKAIEKYGWDNFQHEIIASGLTKEEAENFEILLIDKLKTRNDKYGYNRAIGGDIDNVPIGKDNPISKCVYQFSLDGQFIKKWDCISDIKRELGFNDSSIVNCCKGRKKTMYGFLWSYTKECKNYIKPQSKIGAKPIIQYDLLGNLIKKYKSINIASSETNIDYRQIYRCCEDKNAISACGFIWGYEDNTEIIQNKIQLFEGRPYYQNIKRSPTKNAKQIEQYTLDGIYIKTFLSARDASFETGANLRHIYSVCECTRKSCGGFVWKYKLN